MTWAPLSGKYGLVMVDPPWTFQTRSAKGVTAKGAGGQYRTMTLADIKGLPVRDLAAADCVLWLWATNPMLPHAIATLEAWGFTFKTSGAWVKRGASGKLGFGTGYVLRCASEPFLIGTIGRPVFARTVRTIVEAPRREHSRKPDAAYRAAEALVPGADRRADVFARERRDGWDAWGDESEKFGREPEFLAMAGG